MPPEVMYIIGLLFCALGGALGFFETITGVGVLATGIMFVIRAVDESRNTRRL